MQQKNIRRGDVIVFMSDEYFKKNIIVRVFSSIIYTLTFTILDITNIDKNDNNSFFIKRVIGIPGDSIKFKLVDNIIVVFINNVSENSIINLNYKVIKDNSDKYPLINEYDLKKNEYYVLGDNRKLSYDSRIIGGINSKQIIGKAIIKYNLFPISRLKIGFIK